MLRFAANRGALLLVVRACFDLTKQMLRETTREGKKRGSVSSSGAPAKRPHAKRALAENGDLRGHEDVDLHIRSARKLVFLVDTHGNGQFFSAIRLACSDFLSDACGRIAA